MFINVIIIQLSVAVMNKSKDVWIEWEVIAVEEEDSNFQIYFEKKVINNAQNISTW